MAGRMKKQPDPEPPEDHVHELVPHCRQNAACPWVACRVCGYYGTRDGSRSAHRDGYGPADPKGQKL